MADPEHLDILRQGVDMWNEWHAAQPRIPLAFIEAELSGADISEADISEADLRQLSRFEAKPFQPDLREADLSGAKLSGADLVGANLDGANLSEADLSGADLRHSSLRWANSYHADLQRANLRGADFRWSNLSRANLSGANLTYADLIGANLSHAHLSGATCINTNFTQVIFVGTNVENADLTGARIYGISAWDLQLTGTVQRDLIITPSDTESTITVDDLEIAQFIYLLLNNDRLRQVIKSITSKVVLILGHFSPERKTVLDALRDELRRRDYLPVLFDFNQLSNQSTDETISTLAGMARFVIADLTDAKSVLQELRGIVPNRPTLPVQPILLTGQTEPGMFDFFRRFPWMLDIQLYETPTELLSNLSQRVIGPAEQWLSARDGSER